MKGFYLLALLMGFSFAALAQEANCSDGIDNDGDGFIDCFDGDCANQPVCDASYIGKDKLCQDPPEGTLLFGMKLGSASPDRTTLSYGRMAVGDLDRDGIPEMVTTHHNDKKIYILNGNDLSIKRTINTDGVPEYFDHAIANLDDDDCGEIFIVEVISSKYYVTSYDCMGTKLWSTQAYGQPFTIGLADFDHDGLVELYYKNEILDAKTGVKLVNGKGDWSTIDSGPVAVDILADNECTECPGLELVAGGLIYAVDLTPRTAGGGSVGNPIKDFNNTPGLGSTKYYPKYVTFGYINSMTSVADYNLDGYLDVVMNGATSKSATSTTTIFFWDVHNNTYKMFQPKQPNNTSWAHGTGRINLADVDGDGKMNATFVSGARIYSLKEDFTLLWQKTITEQTSGFTSTTVFDFNNDNAVEIVYRDEANLYIIDGKTGNAFTTVTCRSRTANDYPIVVDVDADGATEICVSCATNDNTDINNNNNTPYGQIRTYKSSLEPWVSARKVWNQYAYFNVNVNDDLTIPRIQQKHHLVFSQNICGPGENRALNSFLNQSAILDSKGCKTYPAADVAFVANPSLLNIDPPTCPDQDFHVSFTLQNTGDLDLNGDFPITFYSGDPRLPNATKLSTHTITLNNFKIGDQLDVQDLVVTGTGGTFTLFAVLNDKGTTVPTPISLPNSGFDECNFSNNIVSANVIPKAFPLSTSSTPHVQCGAGPSPPNGSVSAFKLQGGAPTTVGYTFHWFDGTTPGPVGSADYSGSQVTGLNPGTYTVYAVHDAFQCSSDTVQVSISQESLSIGATVNVDKPFTNCKTPDGQLSVTPNSGSLSDYTFEWFEGTVFGTSPKLSDSSVLRFTKALTYSVLVTQISSGCQALVSGTVPDLTVTPVVTTEVTPANCSPANSGQAAANVGGVTAGYSFYWYDGATAKPSEDFLGHTYSGISAGNYTVIARDNTTGCTSNQTVATVPTVSGITVSANITAHQTSCTVPNGAASASVGGTTAGYTFRWFQGDNTITEIGTGPTISGLAAGDYTVEATSTATGCVDTELITIIENLQIPTVTPSVVANQTYCLPANGSVTAVATGSPGPYIYYWFNGNVGTPDTTVADYKGQVYSGISAGFYTVVAVDANTRCGSARGLVQVIDQTVNPVVTTTSTSQASCDPANPNGQASANVGGSTNGYKFRWFAGADTTTFLTENPILSNRAAGTYTVKAVNRVSGCFTTRLVVINDVSAPPTLNLVKQDNSICSSTIGFTGSVTASLSTNPNVQAGHTFVYEWRKDGVVIPGETGPSISGIDAGTYSVTVRNEALDCVSDPASIVVNDAVDLPVLTTTSLPSTNCDPALANGGASVLTVDGIAVGSTTDYTYQWHTGSGTSTPIHVTDNPSADDAALLNVQGGATFNYTVLVTNTLTGCSNTAVINVGDAKALPQLALAMTPNGVCDPLLTSPSVAYNGTITATVSNLTGSLGDYTFALGGGTGVQDASPNHNRFIELNGGINYTVTATHTPTGCVSDPASIQVQNDQAIPVITTSSDGSTNCVPGLEDGRARVVTVDGAPAAATGFVFAWTGPAGFSVATNPTRNDIELTNVQGGAGFNYTVLVTNQTNGCQNTAVVNVADEKQLPALTLATTPNSICDPSLTDPSVTFNGTVTATVTNIVGALTDYTFVLGGGTGVQDASPNHNRFLQLNGGINYSVTATHTTTGCVSTPANIQVVNDQAIPVLTTSSNGSTNCQPGLEDGRARVVTVDGTPATTTGFTFAWTGPAAFSVASNPTRNAIELANVQGGAGYNYTVLVTNQSNGCQNTAVVNVGDNKQIPSLTLTAVPNSICDPTKAVLGGGDYDGQVTAAINTVGNYASSAAGDFNFTWSTGLSGVGQNILANLDVGTYTVTAVHTATGCSTNPHNTQVTSAKVLPVITMSSTPSQNCAGGAPDGVATVTNVIPNGRNYDYRWFEGNSTAGTPGPVELNTTLTTSSFANVQGGINGASFYQYTVEVTILQTGCVNTATVSVEDDSELPVLGPLAGTDNENCSPTKNGTATITALTYRGAAVNPADFGNFDFAWSGGTQGPAHTITGLAAGSYTLTVRHIDDNCTSNPVSVTIDDDLYHPQIDVAAVDQTSCDPLTPNGSLTASIDETTIGGPTGVIAGYTFSWEDDVAGTVTASNAIANLKGNQNYTITVTRDATQCVSVQTVFLDENLVIPSVTVTPTDATTCDPANGSLVATDLVGHTYYWYNDNDAPDENFVIANFDFNGGKDYLNLVPGDYTLVVVDNATQCKSQPVISAVGNATPPIYPVAINASIPAECDQLGTLDGGVHLTLIPNDFTTNEADDEIITAFPLALLQDSPVIITRTSGALPGSIDANKIYYIKTIAGNVLTLSETPGGATVDITSNGVGSIGDLHTAGYSFEWYAGIPSPTDPGLGSINYFHNPPVYDGPALSTLPTLDNVPTGLYTLQVTNNATGCKAYLPHTLPYSDAHTVLRIEKTNSEICPYTIGNGTIRIQIENPPGTVGAGKTQKDYRVSLLQGTNVMVGMMVPPEDVNPFYVSQTLAPGSYAVSVMETFTGKNCVITQDVIIGADALPPVVNLLGSMPNTACDPSQVDGQIEISIDKDPNDLTVGSTYDLIMAPDPNTQFPILGAGTGNQIIPDLAPGAYTFTVTSSNNCVATKTFTVLDNPVKSQFTAAGITITNAEYCDVNLEQSARVLVNQLNIVGGGAENIADYRFDWYTDASLSTNIYSGMGVPGAGKGGEDLSNVGAPLPATPVTNGAYWIVATKINDASGTGGVGCVSPPYNVNINANKVLPEIVLTPFGDSSCDPNVFEGSLQVDVTTASGPGAGATYAYNWAPTGASGQPANSISNTGVTNVFANINEGTYQLTAVNEQTGCVNTLSTTIQKIAPPVFTVDAVATELTNCATFDGRIDNLQVFVNGSPGNVADFDYVWFRSDLSPGSLVLNGQDAGVPVDTELTLATYPAIGLDKYFIKAVRKAGGAGVGCESAPLRKDIEDARIYPQVSFATVSSTACDGNFDGQITVTASTASGPGQAANYNFEWLSDPDGAGAAYFVSNSPNNNTASPFTTANTDLVGEGTYAIRVTNFVTQCFTDGTVEVTRQTVPMEIMNVTPTHVDLCSAPNGTGTVTAVSIGGGPGNTADFVYTWSSNADMSSPLAADDPALTQSNLDVGTYYVLAKRNAVISPVTPGVTGSGCVTAPIPFTVLDHRVMPTISFATVSSTACDGNFDGQITVTASTASGPGQAANYNFEWLSDPDGAGAAYSVSNSPNNNTASPFTTANTDLVGEGTYAIRVTNFVTQCFTDGTVEVTRQTVPMEIVNVAPTHVDLCSTPNGTGTVAAVSIGGGPGNTTDFVYTWSSNADMSLPFVTDDASVTQTDLNSGTYYVLARRNAVVSPATPGVTGSGCVTAPIPFTVLDHRVIPTISFETISSTSCDGNFDGQITVTANTASGPGAGAGYNFEWISDPDGPGAAYVVSNSANDNTASPFTTLGTDLVGPGAYAVRVTNFTTKCFVEGNVTLQQNDVPVTILAASATPQQICNLPADGSVSVDIADVRVGGNPVVAGISFEWSDVNGNVLGATNTIPNLPIGLYTVRATRTAGASPASGCVSAPFDVEVLDAREYPVLNLSATANTACIDTYDAEISISATTAGIGNASNYDITWTSTPGGFVSVDNATDVPSPYTTLATDNIGIGNYAVTVVNRLTGCSSEGFVTVFQNTTPVQILDVTKLDQRDCAPFDGSITIDTNDPAHVNVLGPYTFAWERDGVALNPVPDNILPGINAGVYTVTGTKVSGVSAGCVTAPFSVTILDLTERPVVELQSIANYACDPAFANGEISATIFDGTVIASPADYDLQWFAGKNVTVGPVLGTAPQLTNQMQGDYTLLVVDNTSPNRGCSNYASLAIDFDPTSFSLAVAATDQNLCAPAQNGSVMLTGITEVRNGVSTPIADPSTFEFLWTDEVGVPHPSTPAFTAGVTSLSNLLAGKYHVQVRNAVGCVSSQTAGVVRDLTVLPVITLENFENPVVCLLPETPGYLQVSADHSLNFGNYTFEWFEGPDDTGTLVEPNNPTLDNVLYSSPLEYTVRVTNLATQCVNHDTYRFAVDTVQIQVLASATARASCLVDDGTLFATTVNGIGALYNYEWYSGPTATGTPVYTTKDVAGAPIGQYTVIAVHPTLAFCQSTSYTTRVSDGRVMPPVVAVQRNPLTYCDPANPNGVAFASVNDEVNGYVFDWYQGDVGGTSFYTGPEVSGLTATTYVVQATHVVTGCQQTASITIDNDPVNVPEPTVVVVSHHTNCVVPDGILQATVGGTTLGYILNWYNGNGVKPVADAEGEFYRDLERGFYTTTATDIVSGCVSDPVVAEILPFQELPDFDIVTKPTNCEQNIGEAMLVLKNNVDLYLVEWHIGSDIQYGTMLSDLPKGEFTVIATTYAECSLEKSFEIRPEILVFNGISRNNDGQNDFFEIACIEDFPQNNVKIFNRAGTLVYEANGYDNQDVLFDGVSNRGISLLGTDLPDGTYFYIIDKRDGSEPKTGYLELLR